MPYRSLLEVSELLGARALSPVELTEQMLERIGAVDGALQSYVRVTAEQARRQAAEAEAEIQRGELRGPLHGIPLAVKDLMATASVPTACGSPMLADRIPDHDAAVLRKLRAAGAVILGKLALTEFAMGGYHPEMQVPRNPWDQSRWAGVSSSGSGVATAAGLCYGALGTDTGGSIRFPSAANGVVGIKPTYGRVSAAGVFPLAPSLDHVGPMARRVRDAAVILQAIAGYDGDDANSLQEVVPDFLAHADRGAEGLRIGFDVSYWEEGAHPEVSAAVAAAVGEFDRLGAKLLPVRITAIAETCEHWYPLTALEAAEVHAPYFPAHADRYGPVFRQLLEDAASYGAAERDKAREAARRAKALLEETFAEVDVLLCPSAALPAMPLEEAPPGLVLPPEVIAASLRFTAPFNFSGHPTISLPCGFSSDGLPLSLQLVGRHGDEATIIGAAHAYEEATAWHERHPPIYG